MTESPLPSLLQPLTIRGRTLKNRIVISPMCQHAGRDGFATDWHLVHYGKFVLGGAALVLTESTAVAADSRVGIDDLGIWSDAHVPGLKRLADFAHENGALMGVQLAHSGRKAFSQPLWQGGRALSPADLDALGLDWRRVGPSALAASAEWSTPQALTAAQIAEIRDQHVAAARRADAAGMDVLELHFGHGYLVASFLSPLANLRDDAYGGSRDNRMRLAIEIARDIRAVWPSDKPLFARLSQAEQDRVFDAHGLSNHRLNACGYALGAKFTPSWMDPPMFYERNDWTLAENQVYFAHMILMDSASQTAMCLGRTYLVTKGAAEPLNAADLDLVVKAG